MVEEAVELGAVVAGAHVEEFVGVGHDAVAAVVAEGVVGGALVLEGLAVGAVGVLVGDLSVLVG